MGGVGYGDKCQFFKYYSELKDWVNEVAQLTSPKNIRWCTGSTQEYQELTALMLKENKLFT